MQELTAAQYEYIGRYLAEHLRNGATIKGSKDCLKFVTEDEIDGGLEIIYEPGDKHEKM